MKANTAIGAICAVCSLLLFTTGKKRGLATFLAVITFLIGVLTVSEYVFHWDAQIDELLFRDKKTVAPLHPGRMAFATASGFVIFGLSLGCFRYKKMQFVTDVSLIAVATIAFLAFTGYLYDVKRLYTITFFNTISISSTLVLIFISFALLFSRPDTGLMAVFKEKTKAVRLGTRQILFLLVILLVFGWLCLKGHNAGFYDIQFGMSIMIAAFSMIFFFISIAGIRNLSISEKEKERLYKEKEESEAFSRGVLASLSSCVAVIDENGTIIAVNKAWENFATENGVTTLERVATGTNYFDVCNKAAAAGDDIAAQAVKGIQSVLKKETKVFELQYPCHSAEKQRWFLLRAMLFEDGKPMAVVAHNDVTDIVLAKQKLEESENRLRTIFNTEPECIKLLNKKGELLDMNPAGLAMIEADNLQAVQGKSLLQFLVPEYRNDFFNLIKKVFDGESGTLEFEIIGLKGTRRRMDTHAVPMRDANQNIIAQLAITRDVTVKKKGERDLRESESKYRTLMQQAGDSIVLFNEMGQILEANESALQLLGYSSEEYKNMSLKDFVFEEDLRDSPFRFDLLKGGEPTITRRRLKRKDGSAVETELHVKKLSEGRYLGAARDLTDRIKAEQQLRESENRLREITASLPGVVYQIVITNDGKYGLIF